MLRRVEPLPRGALIALCLTLGACAADGAVPIRSGFTGSAMEDGASTVPPGGWILYCLRNSQDASCRVADVRGKAWRDLQAAQAMINTLPRRADDPSNTDLWRVADARGGDCDDLALAGRRFLLDRGWDPARARLATAWTETGDYHTVLTVDVITAAGPQTFVLDSRYPSVMTWRELAARGYRWDKRQSRQGRAWVQIANAS
jgi:predicted transglutaminase-like cysteine proteinase